MPRSPLDKTAEQKPVLNKDHGSDAGVPGESQDSKARSREESDSAGPGGMGPGIEPAAGFRPDQERGRDDRSHSRRRRTLRSLRRRRNSKNVER